MKRVDKDNPLLLHIGLQLCVMLYACTGIFTKLASRESALTLRFVLLYSGAILIMFVYALLWQQFLKRLPLSTAYAHRCLSSIWSILIGRILFMEHISINQIIGSLLLLVGVYLIVTGDEK